MPQINIPIAQGYYQSPSLAINNQRCVNLYPNVSQSATPFPESLLSTQGINQLASTGLVNQVNRGSWVMAGIPYFVNGTSLYRLDRTIDADGNEVFSTTNLGTIEGDARCSFADNGTQLFILNPLGKGYIWNGASLAEVTDVDFTTSNGKPIGIVYIDSFFVTFTDEKKLKKSASNDGFTWSALEFGGAEQDPDEIVGCEVYKNQIYVFGSETIEVLYNAGLGGYPFQRQGFAIPKGLSSQFAVTKASNNLIWLGSGVNETPAVWVLAGSDAQKVSTTAIDAQIASFTDTDIQNCFAWAYSDSGASFAGFTFPSKTFVYDFITARWHERESSILNTKGFVETQRWRANSIAQAYNKIIVGDSQSGRIGELSNSTYTEYDRPLIRYFTTTPIYNNGNNVSIPRCLLEVESGVGNYTNTAEPQVEMRASRDGRVYNDAQSRSMGKQAEYSHKCIWRRLGRFPNTATLEFRISDPVKVAILGLVLDVR